jgi:CBS domain-containing protein
MKVREAMTRNVRSCRPEEGLDKVGEAMIEVDCGVLPVVSRRQVVGVVTDRDVCLALTRSDRRSSEVTVAEVMSADVAVCLPDDDVHGALATMRRRRVRRLPVVGPENELVGLLSLDDIAVRARALETAEFQGPFYVEIGETLQTINRRPKAASAPRRRRVARGAASPSRQAVAGRSRGART